MHRKVKCADCLVNYHSKRKANPSPKAPDKSGKYQQQFKEKRYYFLSLWFWQNTTEETAIFHETVKHEVSPFKPEEGDLQSSESRWQIHFLISIKKKQ